LQYAVLKDTIQNTPARDCAEAVSALPFQQRHGLEQGDHGFLCQLVDVAAALASRVLCVADRARPIS